MRWYHLPLFLAFMGCSLQKIALRSSTPIFEKSSNGLVKEGNWDYFKAATPGNLKLLELLWDQDTDNLKLQAILVKGYAGYAFAVPETLYFEDMLLDVENSQNKKDAIYFHTKALDFGIDYLEKKGIKREELLSNDEAALIKKLNKLDEDDFVLLAYLGQAWGSLINLQKDNVALVSQVPRVKLLFDRVCSVKPDFENNMCDLFYAQYEAARPKMLGGNPEKGRELFLEAIKKSPYNHLIKLNYIQYVVLPNFDEEIYIEMAKELKAEFAKFEDLSRETLLNVSPYKDYQELNLYNGIAKKRFDYIEKNKANIF